jgi:hypothetical protein
MGLDARCDRLRATRHTGRQRTHPPNLDACRFTGTKDAGLIHLFDLSSKPDAVKVGRATPAEHDQIAADVSLRRALCGCERQSVFKQAGEDARSNLR